MLVTRPPTVTAPGALVFEMVMVVAELVLTTYVPLYAFGVSPDNVTDVPIGKVYPALCVTVQRVPFVVIPPVAIFAVKERFSAEEEELENTLPESVRETSDDATSAH